MSGIHVEPKDPDALADALERLIREPETRRAIGAAGAKRAPEYDWNHVTGELVRVYEEAIQRHRLGAAEPASLPVRTPIAKR